MKTIVCIILCVTVSIAVIYGGCKAFSLELYLNKLNAFVGYFVDVPSSLGTVWTHDYFNVNIGIQWVDSILGDGLVEGIVNTCYRVIDTFKVLGTALKSFLFARVYMDPLNPNHFVDIKDDIYKWTGNDYIYDTQYGGAEEETLLPTTPNHRGGN